MSIGKMFLRKQTNAYYCKIDGSQVRLSPDYDQACKRYADLVKQHGCPRVPTVSDITTLYIDTIADLKPSTITKRKRILDSLCKSWGPLRATDLDGDKLKQWMRDRHPTAGNTTQHDRYGVVQMAYNWAKRAGHVNTVPMAGLRRPKPAIREVYLLRERWPELLELCNPWLQLLCEFLLVSGARPQEARALLVGDWMDGRFLLGVHRSKGEDRGRSILMPREFAERVKATIRGRSADDHVFLNHTGQPIGKDALVCAFRRLRVKMAMPGLVAYSLRHSYAVDKLRFGAKPEFVAECMGHASTDMIFKRYGHFAQQTEQLQEVAELNSFSFSKPKEQF